MNARRTPHGLGVGASVVAIAMAFGGVVRVWASPPNDPTYAPVSVETRFKYDQPARRKRIQPALEKGAAAALESRHGVPVSDSANTRIVLHLVDLAEEPTAESALVDYAVLLEVHVGEEIVGDADVTCMGMGEAELVDCAIDGLPAILSYLPEAEPAAERAEIDESRADADDSGAHDDRPAPIGPLGITGVVVGAVGVGLSIAGAVYLGRGDRVSGADSGAYDVVEHNPKVGAPMLGAGIGVLVVGAILAGVDVGRRAKQRGAGRNEQVSFTVRPGYAGLSLRARF